MNWSVHVTNKYILTCDKADEVESTGTLYRRIAITDGPFLEDDDEKIATVSVKWDGCSNWEWNGITHWCGHEQVREFAEIMDWTFSNLAQHLRNRH